MPADLKLVHNAAGALGGGPTLPSGPEPPDNGLMEARVAKLEASLEFVQRETSEIKSDLREVRKDMREDFRILFGAIVVVALGLAGLLAKGFHWF